MFVCMRTTIAGGSRSNSRCSPHPHYSLMLLIYEEEVSKFTPCIVALALCAVVELKWSSLDSHERGFKGGKQNRQISLSREGSVHVKSMHMVRVCMCSAS